MAHIEIFKCQKCGCEISKDDSITKGNQILCEECYIKATHRIQICDPFAVRSAKQFREKAGLESTEGLTDLQKAIFEFIKSRGKVTNNELCSMFSLSPQELENKIAILRHCELVKGQKEANTTYLIPF